MGQSDKQLYVHITQSGRPIDRFPVFIWKKENKLFLILHRVDVSDTRNSADPIYKALVEFAPGVMRIANLAIFLSRHKIHMEIMNEEPKE